MSKKQFNVEVGRNLRAAREAAGFTQVEVGIKLEIEQGSVSDHERGRANIPAFSLRRYAEVYGVTYESLVGPAPRAEAVVKPARRRKRADHVVVFGETMYCYHCGATADLGLPADLKVVAKRCRSYGTLHRGCAKAPAGEKLEARNVAEAERLRKRFETIAHGFGKRRLIR